MKRYKRCTAVILISMIFLAFLSGCFDRRELDTLGIVMGVAIDKAETEGETELTVQMANPAGTQSEKKSKSSKGGGEAGSGTNAYINVSKTGKNINYIIREMQHKMSRRIYVAHSQVIVIGEELAKNGVRDCLDFFARAAEARMTVYLFIAKGKAAETLDITPEFEKLPSVELAKILKDQKITSHAPIVTEFEFVGDIMSKTTAAVAPIVKIIDDGGQTRLDVTGCAVFKESRMVGELNEEETRGLLFALNKVKNGVLQTDVKETTATVEIRQAKGSVKPVLYSDGTAEFKVTIDVTVGLGDQSGTANLSDPEIVPYMVSAAAMNVKEEVQSAVDKSKELDADVFGFGDYLNRRYPDEWEKMKDKWNELYKNIKVDISVNAKADGNGRIVAPLIPKEG